MTAAETIALVRELFAVHGGESYGEHVTMEEHSLLTAGAAVAAGAGDELTVACLLHDVGHFLQPPDDAFGFHDHGESAATFLAQRFPPSVTEPVRLHIDAKRYLCAIEPGYHDRLSAASQYTLTQQGGVMSDAEAAEFAARPFAADAVRLRRWEDQSGKRVDQTVPSLDEFAPLIERVHL